MTLGHPQKAKITDFDGPGFLLPSCLTVAWVALACQQKGGDYSLLSWLILFNHRIVYLSWYRILTSCDSWRG